MPKLAVKRDTDYRLTVMIRGDMAAQEISIEKAAEYAGMARSTLVDRVRGARCSVRRTLRVMREVSVSVEEMRAAISYPW